MKMVPLKPDGTLNGKPFIEALPDEHPMSVQINAELEAERRGLKYQERDGILYIEQKDTSA